MTTYHSRSKIRRQKADAASRRHAAVSISEPRNELPLAEVESSQQHLKESLVDVKEYVIGRGYLPEAEETLKVVSKQLGRRSMLGELVDEVYTLIHDARANEKQTHDPNTNKFTGAKYHDQAEALGYM